MGIKIASNVVKSSKSSTGYVYVSTAHTFDHGLETMVFACTESGTVTDWCEIDAETYDDEAEALAGHATIVAEWRA